MVWQKGRSGNPAGRPPAGESFAEALRSKLTPEKMAELADKAIALAEDGDLRALVFIRDTLDGRPRQALEHSGAGLPLLILDRWNCADDRADTRSPLDAESRQ
jgi:hypothetical protein